MDLFTQPSKYSTPTKNNQHASMSNEERERESEREKKRLTYFIVDKIIIPTTAHIHLQSTLRLHMQTDKQLLRLPSDEHLRGNQSIFLVQFIYISKVRALAHSLICFVSSRFFTFDYLFFIYRFIYKTPLIHSKNILVALPFVRSSIV